MSFDKATQIIIENQTRTGRSSLVDNIPPQKVIPEIAAFSTYKEGGTAPTTLMSETLAKNH